MAHSRPKRYTNWYLRDWLKTLEVSQAQLAERTDLGKAAISLLFNDRQDYSPPIIRDISKALNIAPYELLMHPKDAMALRQWRKDAFVVVRTSEAFETPMPDEPKTGTGD